MPIYIGFYRRTEQGARTIKEAPGRIEAGIKATERMGGKSLAFYVCENGEYDYVSIGEMPSGEVAEMFALGLESLGSVRVKWNRVYTPAEFTDLVAKLP